MNLKFDEEFQTLIPPLTDEEFKTLEESIIDEGCRDPLVIWDDIILDGHNRYNICKKHKIIFKRVEKNFDNREQAKIWILENQLGRRNLNEAQRIDVVDKLFGLKEKQLAKERQLSGKNLGENLPKGRASEQLGNKAKVSEKTYRKGKQIKDKNLELWEKCLDGKISIDKADKELKSIEKEQKRTEESKQAEDIQIDDNEIDLRQGDFIEVLDDIPDNSIDLILTDPPYPIEYILEWGRLGIFAKKKLKKNGFLIAYCGHKNLYESMRELSGSLKYYWTFALILKGNTQLLSFNNIDASWKPILIYQNEYKKIKYKIKDIVYGSGRSKTNVATVNRKDWQQSENELEYLINNFSKPGDTIADPFAGSGTTLISVKKNNRIGIGAEKDKKTYNIAKKRISEAL